MELTDLTLTELRDKLRSGEVTSVAATEAALARIEAVDGDVKSYLLVTAEAALEQARAADVRLAKYFPGENFDLTAEG